MPGLGTECFALRALGREHSLILAAELQQPLRNFLEQHHSPKNLVEDCTGSAFLHMARNMALRCDLFVAGFPCQPFSAAGSNGGTGDVRGRVIHSLIKWITEALPGSFVLENVSGFVYRHRNTFRAVMASLRGILDPATGKLAYRVRARILNSRDFGTPQALRGKMS